LTALTLSVPGLGETAVPLSPMLRAGFVASESIITLPVEVPADVGAKVTLKEALCPGVRVSGVVNPEMLKAAGATVACEMCASLPPVFLTVSVWVWLCPVWTLVNVKLAGVALRVAGVAVPVPERAAAVGVLEALLAKDAVADAAPDELGVNLTVNVTGVEVVTVTGNVRPLIENSEGLVPLKLTEDTVTLAPVALSVPVWVPLVPTTTFPTLTELTLSVPGLGATADPVSPTPRAGSVASESIVTLPLELPADCGAKVTLKEALCPGARVSGVDNPEMLNAAGETVASEIFAFMPPVFLTVSVWV
jgi:hypothetical protein